MASAAGNVAPEASLELVGSGMASAAGNVAPMIERILVGLKIMANSGYLGAIKGVIILPHGLLLKYEPLEAQPARIKMDDEINALILQDVSDDHAGCVRMKIQSTVKSLVLER
jgi:hypothetical protein